MSIPSIPHTSDSEDPSAEGGERPSWLVSVLVVLVCLAVIASGWGVARLAVGAPLQPLETLDAPESRPPRAGVPSAEADPQDAEAFVAGAAGLVEESSAFHITFTVHDGVSMPEGPSAPDDAAPEDQAEESHDGPELDALDQGQERRGPGVVPVSARPGEGVRGPLGTSSGGAAPDLAGSPAPAGRAGHADVSAGRGRVMYDATAEPEFDHFFTTSDGQSVYRYDVGDGQLVMTADRGLELLDPPSEADGYLCSRGFGSAKLREILDTSTDLTLAGLEEVDLRWPGQRSTYSAYRYTGTFSAKLGGYDTAGGVNTLTVVPDAAFELWIDEQGYPRRLDYRAPGGVGESYEYHSFG